MDCDRVIEKYLSGDRHKSERMDAVCDEVWESYISLPEWVREGVDMYIDDDYGGYWVIYYCPDASRRQMVTLASIDTDPDGETPVPWAVYYNDRVTSFGSYAWDRSCGLDLFTVLAGVALAKYPNPLTKPHKQSKMGGMLKILKKDRVAEAVRMLEWTASYPGKGEKRRTKDGYPGEIAFDEFAYKRIVDWYREHLRRVASILKDGIDPNA